jgi:hypothetical protein
MDMTETTSKNTNGLQLVIIAALVVAAFLGAYRFASARSAQGAAPAAVVTPGGATASGAGGGACCGGASDGSAAAGSGTCCGGSGSGAATKSGVTGAPVEGKAQVSGGVQAIGVKVGTTYSPNIIRLKAGVPAEITFGQGGGCTAQVVSSDLGFSEDLSAGPKVVKLPALKAGTYSFSCGMSMVFGEIVVE